MSFASKVLYTGDGVTTQFNVPMPYISESHINVYVNEILQLNPMNYTWSGPSTIQFSDAPKQDDAIEIKRWTSPTSTLVDFTDGSVLKADDLDTAYLHNYYLSQEYADSFNELINNALIAIASGAGIVETETDAVIAALVNEMLSTQAAADIQQRIADIDTNAEAIVTLGESLQVQINTLAQGVAAQVFVQPNEPVPGVGGVPDPIPEGARWYDTDDNNAPYIYQGSAWVSITDPRLGQAVADIAVLQVNVADNAAAIVTESVARANADSATAQTLSLLGAEVDAGAAFLLNLNTVKVGASETIGSRFTSLQASIDSNAAGISTNASDIITEQSVRAAADTTNANAITALDSRMTTAEGDIAGQAISISQLQTDVSTNAGNISSNASAITAVQSEVDLRARSYRQTTAPTGDLNAGDLWFDSDDGNKLYRYNGTIWVAVPDGAIAGNASAISTLQTDVSTNQTNISSNASAITGIDTRLTTAEGTIAGHSSSISSLQSQVTSNDGDISANASAITSLQASVTTLDGEMNTAQVDIVANASAITTANSNIASLEARYGVSLNVNGYVQGFIINNGGPGAENAFVIMADKFAVVDPSGDPAEPEYVPFSISGGKINLTGDVVINGNLILNGSIAGAALINGTIGSTQIGANAISTTHISANAVTANEIAANQITATHIGVGTVAALGISTGSLSVDGTLTLGTSGKVLTSGVGFESGTGVFMGYDTSAYKFYVGNYSGGNYLSWDGSELVVRGDLSIGSYTASTTEVLLSAPTLRTTNSFTWVECKKFKINKPGQVRVYFDRSCSSVSGGSTGHNSEWRVKLDGSVQYTTSAFTTTVATVSTLITTTENSQYITIEHTSGERNPVEPVACGARTQNAEIRALIDFGESVITD